MRGPGETQLETDRREVGRRISTLKRELDAVRAHRARHRARRRRSGMPVVALVGYTNAGKSTMLNALSGADVLAVDQLFATLDPTTRRIEIEGGGVMLFSDTVGFIQKLPPTLLAAFRATLEEIGEADVIVHIIDASHRHALEQADTVDDTLAELEVERIARLVVLNKMDLPSAQLQLAKLLETYQDGLPVSALTGEGVDAMLAGVKAELQSGLVGVEAEIPYSEGRLLALYHEVGTIEKEEHGDEGVRISGRMPARYAAQFAEYLTAVPDEVPPTD